MKGLQHVWVTTNAPGVTLQLLVEPKVLSLVYLGSSSIRITVSSSLVHDGACIGDAMLAAEVIASERRRWQRAMALSRLDRWHASSFDAH